MNKESIDIILEAAVSAPSGDNIQPWKLTVDSTLSQINIYNQPDLDNSYFNYNQCASHISHGAVIENIDISAKHLGYRANIQVFPNKTDKHHVARIDFSPDESDNAPLYDAIKHRLTNRSMYSSIKISEESLTSLRRCPKDIDSITTYFCNDLSSINKLARLFALNDKIVFEHKNIHQFLFRMIRWTQDEIDLTKDGMPLGTLGLSKLEALFFPLMKHWKFVNLANFVGLSQIIGLKCRMNCSSASLLGIIAMDTSDNIGFVQAGRAFQRVWLEATRQGLSLQPIVGIPLLIYRLNSGQLNELSSRDCKKLKAIEQKTRELFGVPKEKTIAVGFRIGRGSPIDIRTPRKPIDIDYNMNQ